MFACLPSPHSNPLSLLGHSLTLHLHAQPEMQKVADAADISVLFFSAGANFWAILGHFWAILAVLGHFGANVGNFGSFLGYFG